MISLDKTIMSYLLGILPVVQDVQSYGESIIFMLFYKLIIEFTLALQHLVYYDEIIQILHAALTQVNLLKLQLFLNFFNGYPAHATVI